MHLTSALVFFALVSPGFAQTTYVVDASGGAGSQFRDIQPAVDAAVDGDRILVRPGDYTGFAIDQKGIAVLGAPGVRLQRNSVLVRNTRSDQTVVLADLEQTRLDGLPRGIRDCDGLVLLERIESEFTWVVDCADVRVSSCQFRTKTHFERSHATVTDSVLWGGTFVPGAAPGLNLVDSTAHVSRCDIQGQNQVSRAPNAPGVVMAGMSLLILGDDGSHRIAAGSGAPHAAISGSGTVIRDPNVVLLPSSTAPPTFGVNDRIEHTPSLQVLGAPVGGSIEVDLTGRPSEAFALVFGLPGQPTSVPGIRGILTLGLPVASELGTFGGATSIHRSYGAGAGLPPGITLCWQAVTSDAGGWVLSNAATYTRTR